MAPATAMAMAMAMTTMPWVLARVANGTASVIIAVPETRPRFQPSPKRASARASRTTESAGAAAAVMPAARRTSPEAAATVVGPMGLPRASEAERGGEVDEPSGQR